MRKKHLVRLTDGQRAAWRSGSTARSRSDSGTGCRSGSGPTPGSRTPTSPPTHTAANVRKRFAAERPDAAPTEKPRSGGPANPGGKAEAVVIARACSPVPEGRTVWTAGIRANRLGELRVVESVPEDTIPRVLEEATSSRGRRSRGASRRG